MIRLGKYFGINVFLHWTFLLAMGYFAYSTWSGGGSLLQVLAVQTLLILVFSFVLLHEYGHALTARAFGVKTREIVLTPVGGVAMLMGIPRSPVAEILIALAGPFVNLILMGVFAALSLGTLLVPLDPRLAQLTQILWSTLLQINFILFSFNLIPAFPMDGGRILRALLATMMNYEQATRVAVLIGQILAVGFVVFGGYFGQYQLALVGVFVLLAASGELRRVEAERAQNLIDREMPQ